METWAWLLAYVVGFGLLQLVLYHHFRRNDATPDSTATTPDSASAAVDDSRSSAPEGPGIYCQHCGARNDHFTMVRYCRECVNPLR